MLEWIGKGMKEDPSGIIEKDNILLHVNVVKALENFRTDNHF
jgi:hypothetical protein